MVKIDSGSAYIGRYSIPPLSTNLSIYIPTVQVFPVHPRLQVHCPGLVHLPFTQLLLHIAEQCMLHNRSQLVTK